ncbi:hypothetical protein G6M89_03205 [Natronolimnobius sp. AArcel1]|uniref:hypothetical protein n=1 Tax=Natronolimnobius sp. AArcel1 TaxID=1679093 RepID=UPI0013EAB848|nr:hypothetical protein [Natronolimnobius sp. AArcel1]NGM68028.1 hypothetical protein [Natronolimnobius sp. AArcel1]
MTGQSLQTEFEFTLPRGYVDDDGTLHKEGRMRLATAADEIQPLKNPRVQSNSSYLTIVLLSRVVTELGSLETIDESVIENLFVTDLEYLQAMYERVNNQGRNTVETACPECGAVFEVDTETGAQLQPTDDDAGLDHPAPGGTAHASDALDSDIGAGDDADEMAFEDSDTDSRVSDDAEEAELGNPTE